MGVYVDVPISACVRTDAHLRNGSRPGYRPVCMALGTCPVYFLSALERLAHGLYASGEGVLLSELGRCLFASSGAFQARFSTKVLWHLSGLQGGLPPSVLVDPQHSFTGRGEWLCPPVFQPEDYSMTLPGKALRLPRHKPQKGPLVKEDKAEMVSEQTHAPEDFYQASSRCLPYKAHWAAVM